MIEKLDIIEIIQTLVKRWWVMVILSFIFGITSYGYSRFVQDKEYVSTGRMYIDTYRKTSTVSEEEITGSEERSSAVITASQRSVLTCIEVLKSRTVLDQVAALANAETGTKKYKAVNIANKVTMSQANETEVLVIKIRTNDPAEAKMLVDKLLMVGEKELVDIVGVSTARIIDEGSLPATPAAPNIRLQSIVGFVLGFIVGAVILIVIRLLDTRVKSEEDLKKFNVPIIGVIPEIE